MKVIIVDVNFVTDSHSRVTIMFEISDIAEEFASIEHINVISDTVM